MNITAVREREGEKPQPYQQHQHTVGCGMLLHTWKNNYAI